MLLKKSEIQVTKKVIDGFEYMRIADDVTTPSIGNPNEHLECKTVWFRTGLEEQIIRGEFPENFMRCPRCGGMRFDVDMCCESGGTHCRGCGAGYYDIGWSWMDILFPKREVCWLISQETTDSPFQRFLRQEES